MNTRARFGFVVQYVKDFEAARRFYVEVFGLEVQRDHPRFIQFETFAIASDEPMGRDAGEELYWLVDDAELACEALSPSAEVCLPLKQVPFGKVFGLRDPDGRPRYLLELAKDRPSRSVK